MALCYLQPLVKRLDECVQDCLCVCVRIHACVCRVSAQVYVLMCTTFCLCTCVFLCTCDVFSAYVCVCVCACGGYHHAMSVLLSDSLLQAGLYDMYLGQLVSRYIGSL